MCNMDQYGTMANANCVVQKCSWHPQWILWLAPNSRHVATPESYSFAWFSILFYQNLHFRVSPSVDIDKAWQSHISLIYPKIGVAE